MNICIASLLFSSVATVGLAQIQVDFANLAPGVDAPISDASGNRIIGPSPYVADFFWSINTNASMDSLTPADRNTSFPPLTSYGPGYFTGGTISLPLLPFTYILAQVRVWDTNYGPTYYEARNTGGEFGFSNLIIVLPGPAGGPPPTPLSGLQSFQLQRLPHLGIRLTASNTLLFFWSTNLTSYGLQYNTGFQPSNWITLANVATVTGEENQVSLSRPEGTRFYRLISK